MSVSKWIFAWSYDLLNNRVEARVAPYRHQTAGRVWGDVLEIGAGTGGNLNYFPDTVNLTMVEPDPHMVRRLRQKVAGGKADVAVVQSVGERLTFSNASVDCVVTTLVLCMASDVERVVREILRVLRPGGMFFFYEHVISANSMSARWQKLLSPMWRFLTTGCNLDRDIGASISNVGFSKIVIKQFDLNVGLPVTMPCIVGYAKKDPAV